MEVGVGKKSEYRTCAFWFVLRVRQAHCYGVSLVRIELFDCNVSIASFAAGVLNPGARDIAEGSHQPTK